MEKSEFDKFADEYRSMHAQSISASGESPDFFAEYKIKDVARIIGNDVLLSTVSPTILDFGGGIGTSVPYFHEYLPVSQLTCLDVSKRSLAIAKNRYPRIADFVHFDGATIPFESNSFDIAFAACVFHHINHAEHVGLLSEIKRVLKQNGVVVIFEHNPLNPLTLYAVNNCEFDKNAHLITAYEMRQRLVEAKFVNTHICFRIFFPRLLARLRWLEKYMTWIPFGAQYYVRGCKP